MNPIQLLAALGDFASVIFAIMAIVYGKLIWNIHTNHLPHIYSELRSLRQFMENHDKWERKQKHPPAGQPDTSDR